MTNQLLIPVDGTIPNLALMKVSAYVKSKGDHVDLSYPTRQPDEVWVSAIFTWNKERALSVGAFWANQAKIHYGGTAFDWGKPITERIELPPEIEELDPDYTLYDDDRAVGFCNRGCNRKCTFCDVWRKEGRIREDRYRRITEWVPANMSKVLLLDNDIGLYDDQMHDQIINDCRESGRKLSITQGYDIRCIDQRRAQLLAENKPYDRNFKRKTLYFSWDYIGNEGWVRKGVPMLMDAGFKGRELMCYTIVGVDGPNNTIWPTMEQNLHRYKVLWEEFGVYPYVMIYNNRHDLPMERAFLRWVNKRIHKSCTWEEYRQNPERYEEPSNDETLDEWMPEWDTPVKESS